MTIVLTIAAVLAVLVAGIVIYLALNPSHDQTDSDAWHRAQKDGRIDANGIIISPENHDPK